MGQAAIERAIVSHATDTPLLTTDNLKQVVEGGVAGALTGGLLGGASGIRRDPEIRRPPPAGDVPPPAAAPMAVEDPRVERLREIVDGQAPGPEAPAASPARAQSEVVGRVANPEDGVEAVITTREDGRFGVSLLDTDAGETIGTTQIVSTRENAERLAREAVNLPETSVAPPSDSEAANAAVVGEPERVGVDSEASTPTVLPKELAGAKPNYSFGSKQFSVSFDSDVDKALYIVAQTKPSKRDGGYMDWLRQQMPGSSDAEIRSAGAVVRSRIKELARAAPSGGTLTLPASVAPGRPAAQAAPAPSAAPGRVDSGTETSTPAQQEVGAQEVAGEAESNVAPPSDSEVTGPRRYYVDPETGSDELFRFDEERSRATGLPEGPMRMLARDELKPEDWERRLQTVRQRGYESNEAYVSDVLRSHNEIYSTEDDQRLLVVKRTNGGDAAVVELTRSQDGYEAFSWGPRRVQHIERMENEEGRLLWRGPGYQPPSSPDREAPISPSPPSNDRPGDQKNQQAGPQQPTVNIAASGPVVDREPAPRDPQPAEPITDETVAAPRSDPARPEPTFTPKDGWRNNLPKMREYANALGIPHAGLKRNELRDEIDRHLAGQKQQAAPEQAAKPFDSADPQFHAAAGTEAKRRNWEGPAVPTFLQGALAGRRGDKAGPLWGSKQSYRDGFEWGKAQRMELDAPASAQKQTEQKPAPAAAPLSAESTRGENHRTFEGAQKEADRRYVGGPNADANRRDFVQGYFDAGVDDRTPDADWTDAQRKGFAWRRESDQIQAPAAETPAPAKQSPADSGYQSFSQRWNDEGADASTDEAAYSEAVGRYPSINREGAQARRGFARAAAFARSGGTPVEGDFTSSAEQTGYEWQTQQETSAQQPEQKSTPAAPAERIGNSKTVSARIRVLGSHRCGRGRGSREMAL